MKHVLLCGRYVHYEVDSTAVTENKNQNTGLREHDSSSNGLDVVVAETKSVLYSPQWVHCDLRYFDMTVLGKFSVIMADPPWDIHMELPYGTLSDDEMRQLNIPALQDEGLIFLWVTGR